MTEGNLPPLYPCLFPVKIIGKTGLAFETDVLSVMRRHVDDLAEEKIGRTESSGGKYLSLTIYINAQSREHLEQVYAELNARESVILVL
jgi:putative lipoic acid-binding regulatory protein